MKYRSVFLVAVAIPALALTLAGTASAIPVSCVTFHVTSSDGCEEACGVQCSDGSRYDMACDADIFVNHGFDIEYQEGCRQTAPQPNMDTALSVAQELGVEITDEQAEKIKIEVYRRQGTPFTGPASENLTVPMLRRLDIDYDEAAVEAVTETQQ